MRSVLIALASSLAFLCTGSAPAAQNPGLRVVSESPGALHRADPTVQFLVHSGRTGRDLRVQVTPPGSPPWLPGQKAPVVYVLDGGYGVFAPAALLLGGSRAMLPAYVVTIQYAPGRAAPRDLDMLFTDAVRPDGSPVKGGGGEAFLAFLLDELRPFIEAKYPVDPARAVLVGHSLAGVFTANVLARRPDAFAGYLIASPSVWADPSITGRLAHLAPAAAPRRVFVAYGGAEAPYMIRGGQALAQAVAANPAAFTSHAMEFPGADHVSYYPELPARGLGYLLPQTRPVPLPDPVTLPAETLRPYVGDYVLSDGRKVKVALKGGRLTAGLPQEVSLWPLPTPGRFHIEGFNALLTFDGPVGAPAQTVRIELNGDEALARRAS